MIRKPPFPGRLLAQYLTGPWSNYCPALAFSIINLKPGMKLLRPFLTYDMLHFTPPIWLNYSAQENTHLHFKQGVGYDFLPCSERNFCHGDG